MPNAFGDLMTYYAHNYAGIIGLGLTTRTRSTGHPISGQVHEAFVGSYLCNNNWQVTMMVYIKD